jgi:CheY-like chemotaxis protein
MTPPIPSDPPDRNSDGQAPEGRRGVDASLQGLRVLVAEDEFLVALLLEEELRSLGCSIVGPFTNLAMATQASRRDPFDLAILDINLSGELVYPLADELLAREVPFLLLSGYGAANLPERFRTSPRLAKPYDPAALVREIRRILPELG